MSIRVLCPLLIALSVFFIIEWSGLFIRSGDRCLIREPFASMPSPGVSSLRSVGGGGRRGQAALDSTSAHLAGGGGGVRSAGALPLPRGATAPSWELEQDPLFSATPQEEAPDPGLGA